MHRTPPDALAPFAESYPLTRLSDVVPVSIARDDGPRIVEYTPYTALDEIADTIRACFNTLLGPIQPELRLEHTQVCRFCLMRMPIGTICNNCMQRDL